MLTQSFPAPDAFSRRRSSLREGTLLDAQQSVEAAVLDGLHEVGLAFGQVARNAGTQSNRKNRLDPQLWVLWTCGFVAIVAKIQKSQKVRTMTMSRISIDVTPDEHKKLKALAALQGQTIKDFVLERTLGDVEKHDEEAVAELVAFLDARIERAKKEGTSKRSVEEIFAAVLERRGLQADA